jgi:hypothetical protein
MARSEPKENGALRNREMVSLQALQQHTQCNEEDKRERGLGIGFK